MATQKYLKYPNQTQLDYVLTHYGSINYLFDFWREMDFTNSDDYYDDKKSYKLNTIAKNKINSYFTDNQKVVSTDNHNNYYADLVCNNDMEFKSVIQGDYSDSYSIDYNIDSGLVAIVVGYEGMTLTVEWSITNNGSLKGLSSGTIELTGLPIQNWSKEVLPNSTTKFSASFINLAEGAYTVTLGGSCVQTKTILVLGTPVFQCNNDLSVVIEIIN